MTQYETVVILTPVLSTEEAKSTMGNYVKLMKEAGAEMVHEENWGLKQLAYPIRKKTTGIYHLIEYKAQGDIVSRLEVAFKRDENVIRWLTTKEDKHAIDYNKRRANGEIGRKKEEVKSEEVEPKPEEA